MASPASRASRSNRAQGDLFELLVARDLVSGLVSTGERVSFGYTDELAESRRRVAAAHAGPEAEERLALQEENAAAVSAPVLRLVRERAAELGAPRQVLWTGRSTGLDVGVADLVVTHDDGRTDLTLKSIAKDGKGTARNLGGGALKDLLGVDMACLNATMYEQVLATWAAEVPVERYRTLAALGVTARKSAADASERALAAAVGRAAAELVCDAVVAAFTTVDQQRLREAVAAATATDASGDLFEVVANRSGVTVTPVTALPPGDVTARRVSPTRIEVCCDGVPVCNWQVACTNGGGLSPLCLRSFHA